MIRTLIAVAVAGAFALPAVAQASATGDNVLIAPTGGGAGSTARKLSPEEYSAIDAGARGATGTGSTSGTGTSK